MSATTALIAMSGGVDSSVAAWLLKHDGYDCTGAMMKLYPHADDEDARAVALRLGIPFDLLDYTEAFTAQVVAPFVSAYRSGLTPNPCIACNKRLKFGSLLQHAGETGRDYMATGHYARIAQDKGRYLLKRSADPSRDQSYALYTMTQEKLARTLFPLGGLTKSEVREIARQQGFANAQKRDSQDICFIPDGNYAGFIEGHSEAPLPKGRFLDIRGNDLGEHKGLLYYTVGQRKKLGLVVPEPVYVCALNPQDNTVVVGPEEMLYTGTLTAKDINLIPVDKLDAPMRVSAKIRYGQADQPARVWQTGEDSLLVEFDRPQRAITKGQAVVLYDGDIVVGGGTIT